jgi:hypothetical protein
MQQKKKKKKKKDDKEDDENDDEEDEHEEEHEEEEKEEDEEDEEAKQEMSKRELQNLPKAFFFLHQPPHNNKIIIKIQNLTTLFPYTHSKFKSNIPLSIVYHFKFSFKFYF